MTGLSKVKDEKVVEILFPERFEIEKFVVSDINGQNKYMYIGSYVVQDPSLIKKCLVLNGEYGWKLKRQKNGSILLIPTKKYITMKKNTFRFLLLIILFLIVLKLGLWIIFH